MNTKHKVSTTHNNFVKFRSKEFNSLDNNSRQLPSEAFVKVLKSAPLISQNKKNSPDLRRVSVKPQKGVEWHIKNFAYSPAPITVGGASAPKHYKLNSKELREVQEKICRDRQQRKEVLFALKKAGKGSKVRDAKWSLSSLIRCN